MCTSTLDLDAVDAALGGTVFAGGLHHFATIDSTQTRALADATAGAAAGQVYIADEQTAGRGRGGHAWHSEPDRGLYLTALVRPRLSSSDVLQLSLAAGLAAQSALLQACGLPIDLRWPNDLVVATPDAESRKLGGILTEAALSPCGTLRHAAIGIGINLNQASFPADLQRSATSVRQCTGQAVRRTDVAIALLQELHNQLLLLDEHDGAGSPSVLERFAAGSSWVHGKHVSVAEEEGYTGVTAGLTRDGLLRVQTSSGTLRTVRHGGVRELLTTSTT